MIPFLVSCIAIEILLTVLAFIPFAQKYVRGFINHHITVRVGAPLVRILLCVMFLAACLSKMSSPARFAMLTAQYQMLPGFSVNFFSLWLPAFELVVAAGLVLTKWSREFAGMTMVLMIIFIIALSQTLIRDLGIICGCFDVEGAMDKGGAWISLLRDIAVMWPIIWLWVKGKNRYVWELKS